MQSATIQTQPIFNFYSQQGDRICVRYLCSEDTKQLVDLFEHMSSDSRYHRFLQSMDHLSPQKIRQEAQHIANLYPKKGIGLIAFADLPTQLNAPVGVARYVLLGPERAEFAISLRDDQQGKGIGRQLFRLILNEAYDAGVRHATFDVQTANRRMLHILYELPFEYTREFELGTVTLEFTLDRRLDFAS